MNPLYLYALEQLSAAVSGMATNPGPIQFRLAVAWGSRLIRLRPDDLPPELREEFETLGKLVSWRPAAPGDGTILATCERMDDDLAEDLARRTCALHGSVDAARRELDDREIWSQALRAAQAQAARPDDERQAASGAPTA